MSQATERTNSPPRASRPSRHQQEEIRKKAAAEAEREARASRPSRHQQRNKAPNSNDDGINNDHVVLATEVVAVPRELPEVIDGVEDGIHVEEIREAVATIGVIDEAPEVPEEDKEDNWKLDIGWKLKVAMLVLLFVIGTVTTVSLVLTRKDEAPAPPTTTAFPLVPSAPPTAPPTMSRFSILADAIGSSFEDDFPSSALQVEALTWLADEDQAYLAVDTIPTILLERYAAAYFYFVMQGTSWKNQTGWLSENPVCSWQGIVCTNQGFLATMDLCTCLLPVISTLFTFATNIH
jgi:hypothetical protein